MELGELPADGRRPVRTASVGKRAERRSHAAWSLVDDRAPLIARDPGDPLPPLAAAPGQEPFEGPARPGNPAADDRGKNRGRTGDRDDDATLGRPCRHELFARIAYPRGAGIGHEGEILAGSKMRQELGEPSRIAPCVVADRARRDLVSGEQPVTHTGVLGRDQRDGPEDLERPQRDVSEVPDRGGDDEQSSTGARRRAAAQRRPAAHPRAEPGRRGGSATCCEPGRRRG